MFERFARATREVVAQAHEEAWARGSETIEAEHLLLALTASPTPVAGALAAAGLDHDTLVDALDAEAADALDVVGVSAAGYGPPAPVAAVRRRSRFGASAKRALGEALRVTLERGAKRIEPGHLTLAILRAGRGTVPRALELGDIDAFVLREGVIATL